MKHYTYCNKCSEENLGSDIIAIGEIDSDLMSICKCPNGHEFISGLMHNLFDILYLSGVDSYINGHYSESVMSFTASLERTYEFFLKTTLLKEGLSLNNIDSFWKELRNHSERQLGAFCTQYLKTTQSSWRLDTNMIKFRNDVIHKGHIATSKEVAKYVNYTTFLQMNILNLLKEENKEEYLKLYFHEKELSSLSAQKLQEETGLDFVATSHPSLLKWNVSGQQNVTFEEAISFFEQHYLKRRV